jgi:hypothetical protein
LRKEGAEAALSMSDRHFVARIAHVVVGVWSIVVAACGARTGLDAPESIASTDTGVANEADTGAPIRASARSISRAPRVGSTAP